MCVCVCGAGNLAAVSAVLWAEELRGIQRDMVRLGLAACHPNPSARLSVQGARDGLSKLARRLPERYALRPTPRVSARVPRAC